MLYKNNKKKDNLKILGEAFVKNNKNRGKIIYKNKKYQLQDLFSINNIKDNRIKIGIILDKNIYNKSFMFKDCKSLLEVSNFKYINNIDKENNDTTEEKEIIDNLVENCKVNKNEEEELSFSSDISVFSESNINDN